MSYQIQQKMKRLKSVLRNEFLHAPIQVSLSKVEKEYAQANPHMDPQNHVLADIEHSLAKQLGKTRKDYASFIQQQANLEWLKYGDENTTVFHNSIKRRRTHNYIRMLILDNRVISDPLDIRQDFLSYYSDLLCSAMGNRARLNMQTIRARPILSEDLWPLVDFNFSADEIKNDIRDIDNNKSPGLDGFNSIRPRGRLWAPTWLVQGNSSFVMVSFCDLGILLSLPLFLR
ncbi:unnamed protein product [Amaranthus hypochondriacus]